MMNEEQRTLPFIVHLGSVHQEIVRVGLPSFSNAGHFSGTITTTPAFPTGPVGGTTPGTIDVDFFVANGSQGFLVETDPVAPTFGVIEVQGSIDSGSQARQRGERGGSPNTPSKPATKQNETPRRSR